MHATGYGRDGDLAEKFWSTSDAGEEAFAWEMGRGAVINIFEEGVNTMCLGQWHFNAILVRILAYPHATTIL